MNKTILATVTAAVLVGAFVAFTPLQAFAATQIFTNHETNVSFGPYNVGPICGSSDNVFGGKFNSDVTLWDNNKADFQISEHGDLTDSTTGAHVGQVSAAEHENFNPGGLPITFQVNEVVTCDGNGPVLGTPLHFGATIDQQGNVHLHQ
ncbi:MAG: hypothetical protein ACYDAJ_03825 [Nitrosotalea sp.]